MKLEQVKQRRKWLTVLVANCLGPVEGLGLPYTEDTLKRKLRSLALAALTSHAEKDLAPLLRYLVLLARENIQNQSRIVDFYALGTIILSGLEELAISEGTNALEVEAASQLLERYRAEDVSSKIFKDLLSIQEDVLYRQISELTILSYLNKLRREDFTDRSPIWQEMLDKLIGILQASDGMLWLRTPLFESFAYHFKERIFFPYREDVVTSYLLDKHREVFSHKTYTVMQASLEKGMRFNQKIGHEQLDNLIRAYYPSFRPQDHGRIQGDLALQDQNPIFQYCRVYSYLSLDLASDSDTSGILLISRDSPPGFAEADYNFLTTFKNSLLQIVRNLILNTRLEKMAITDALTQVYNHGHFMHQLRLELARARRYRYPISLLMIDIDFFKKFNDTYGHQAGDLVLREVCATMKDSVRATEVVGRYGGEEFAILVPQAGAKVARKVADKLRAVVEEKEVAFEGRPLHITISIGISSFPSQAVDEITLISGADKALYVAKQSGRNQVRIFEG